MKKFAFLALTGLLLACNNGTDATGDADDTNSTRPRDVNEGITNSTRIANDSVIVPDTNNQGPNPSAGVDTAGPMRKQQNQNNDNNNKQ